MSNLNPCARFECSCTKTWNDKPGEYCCITCRNGTPCAFPRHISSAVFVHVPCFPTQFVPSPFVPSRDIPAKNQNGCISPNCPCPSRAFGFDYCCKTCAIGTPCSTPRHTPSLPTLQGQPHSVSNVSEIKFYDINAPYGEFINFAPSPFFLEGKTWPTVEHYFQAHKFSDKRLFDAVHSQKSPRDAFNFARANDSVKIPNWEQMKERFMMDALRAKYTQNPRLGLLLKSTGKATLLEYSPIDSYWGCGSDGKGLNRLGHLLMQLRSTI